jgi:hypothetical protein
MAARPPGLGTYRKRDFSGIMLTMPLANGPMHIRDRMNCGRTALRFLLLCGISALASAGCSSESRHRTILYDEAWSSAAAVRNLTCAPDFRTSCERDARDGERDFLKSLSAAFQAAPECRTVRFMTFTSYAANAASGYWRLRVDFRPRLERQPFDLGRGTDKPTIGGDDAEHDATYICKAVKNNGVTAIW